MMKKNFKFYFSLWSILLAVFNVVVFILRPVIPGYIMMARSIHFLIIVAMLITLFARQFGSILNREQFCKGHTYPPKERVTRSFSVLLSPGA